MLVYQAELLSESVPAPKFERMVILTGLIANTETYIKKS